MIFLDKNWCKPLRDDFNEIAYKRDKEGNGSIWDGSTLFDYFLADAFNEEIRNKTEHDLEMLIMINYSKVYEKGSIVFTHDEHRFYANWLGLVLVISIIPAITEKILELKVKFATTTLGSGFDKYEKIFMYNGNPNTFSEWMKINSIDTDDAEYIWSLLGDEAFEDAIKMRPDGNICPIIQFDY